MRTFIFILSVLFLTNTNFAQQQDVALPLAILTGIVTEEESKDPVIYGSVALYQNDVLITGVETDFDGKYLFENLSEGIYDLEVSYVGFSSKRITGLVVANGRLNTLDVKMDDSHIGCGGYTIIISYEIPLYQQDGFTSGQTISSAEIKRRPFTRN